MTSSRQSFDLCCLLFSNGSLPSFSIFRASSRSTRRRSFPLGVFGTASTNITPTSRLYDALWSETCCDGGNTMLLQRPVASQQFGAYLHNLCANLSFFSRFDAAQGVRGGDNEGVRELAAVVVRDADYADVCDNWVVEEVALQLRWRNLVCAHLDEFLKEGGKYTSASRRPAQNTP